MVELSRTVRFSVDESAAALNERWARPVENSFAGWPAIEGMGRFHELVVHCQGQVDSQTGYFMNIKRIDEAVREHVLPDLEVQLAGARAASAVPMGELMQRMLRQLYEPLGDAVSELTLRLSPYSRLSIRSEQMNHVTVRQQYEFAAAHRLHAPELSEEENQRLFGKCTNPAGHGHNYRVEVAVRAAIDVTGRALSVQELDELVNRRVIEKLDHKHLNHDVPEFENLNPSVEHIAQVIWSLLVNHVEELGPAAEDSVLEEVRVWETEKTACTYRGE